MYQDVSSILTCITDVFPVSLLLTLKLYTLFWYINPNLSVCVCVCVWRGGRRVGGGWVGGNFTPLLVFLTLAFCSIQ